MTIDARPPTGVSTIRVFCATLIYFMIPLPRVGFDYSSSLMHASSRDWNSQSHSQGVPRHSWLIEESRVTATFSYTEPESRKEILPHLSLVCVRQSLIEAERRRVTISRAIEHHNNGSFAVLYMSKIRIQLFIFLDQVRDVLPIVVLVDPINTHNRRIGPF